MTKKNPKKNDQDQGHQADDLEPNEYTPSGRQRSAVVRGVLDHCLEFSWVIPEASTSHFVKKKLAGLPPTS